MGNTDNRRLDDDRQLGEICESFTFRSCSDFTSSHRFFSDHEDTDSDQSYIEIELGRPSKAHTAATEDPSGPQEELLELRISISSASPLSKFGTGGSTNVVEEKVGDVSESGMITGYWRTTSSVGESGRVDWPSSVESEGVQCGQKQRRIRLPAVQRWLTAVVSTLKVSPEMFQENVANSFPEKHTTSDLPRSKSRKTWRTTVKMKETRVMKFFFKLRAMQIRSFLASLVKNRQGKSCAGTETAERRIQETLRFHHRLAKTSSRKKPEDKRTKSCPGSIKCSPIHGDTPCDRSSSRCAFQESSIQAAIAHCKKSFTPAGHDFSFRSHP